MAAEARALARRYNLDEASANLAALAHDLAAVVPVDERVAFAAEIGIPLSAADRALPALLHGPIAAAMLAARLDVYDRDVLQAVHYHTTLRAGAGPLEKTVFVADKLAYDPSSPHDGSYVPAMRAAGSLDEAALIYLEFLLNNTWRYGWRLHPQAVAAYRDLVVEVGR